MIAMVSKQFEQNYRAGRADVNMNETPKKQYYKLIYSSDKEIKELPMGKCFHHRAVYSGEDYCKRNNLVFIGVAIDEKNNY